MTTGDDRDRLRKWAGEAIDEASEGIETPDVDLVPGAAVSDLVDEVNEHVQSAIVTPEDLETALSGVSLPEVVTLDVDVEPVTDRALEAAETTVEVGGDATTVAIEESGEAATVLVETGGETMAVAVEEGDEVAATAVAEALVAALEEA